MDKTFRRVLSAVLVCMILLVAPLARVSRYQARAAGDEDLIYNIGKDEATVAGCNKDASGELIIPATVQGKPVTKIGCYEDSSGRRGAFQECEKLTKIVISDGVKSIGDAAFSGCTSLTSVTIPDSVTSIGVGAFYDCTSLTSVTIPDSVTSIGDDAFYRCKSLTSVTIPDGVTSIGEYAFSYCDSLTSVTIPDGVTSIGDCAFVFCYNLTSVTIPDSVKSIGEGAFYATGIYNDAGNWENGVLYIGNHLIGANNSAEYGVVSEVVKVVSGDYTIKAGTKTIAGDAFRDCTSLTSVTIGNGVTSIGSEAFYNCTSLTSVTIPDSVTSIGGYAFYNCASLTSVTIPDSVTSIEARTFESCSSLRSVKMPAGIVIIGGSAFENCTKLTNATIPDGAVNIVEKAFYNSGIYNDKNNWEGGVLYIGRHLIKANTEKASGAYTIKDGTKTIADSAFAYCKKITSVKIPQSATNIGWGAFQNCTRLTSVAIPDGVTNIGGDAFKNTGVYNDENNWENGALYIENHFIKAKNEATSEIHTIKDGTKTIAEFAFSKCKSLTGVKIPEGIVAIGWGAFKDCSNLTDVTIPNGVKTIGRYAFQGCEKLTSVTIPDGVTSVGDGAFDGCLNLKDIYYGGSEKEWKEILINGGDDASTFAKIHCNYNKTWESAKQETNEKFTKFEENDESQNFKPKLKTGLIVGAATNLIVFAAAIITRFILKRKSDKENLQHIRF